MTEPTKKTAARKERRSRADSAGSDGTGAGSPGTNSERSDSATTVVVREEQPGDVSAIRQVTREAFGRPAEAVLVDALRERGQVTASLVADQRGRIVGHLLLSPVTLAPEPRGVVAPEDRACAVVGLGPMAVLPAMQRQGVGSLLVARALEHCRHDGYAGVVVLGHPTYYPRFGFVPASRHGIRCEYAAPDEAFMAIELREGALRHCAGTVGYQPAFDEV